MLAEQVADTCFTEVTDSVCPPIDEELPDEVELADELGDDEPEVVPVIFTSCPTCALSFEVSPDRL